MDGSKGRSMQEEVRRFVADVVGCSLDAVNLDTALLGDLEIDGDDASELVERFAKRFKVDLGDFDFCRHFHSEVDLLCGPMDLAQLLWSVVRGRAQSHSDTIGKMPVRIRDLVEAATRRKWPL
jgi:hypothetical protein